MFKEHDKFFASEIASCFTTLLNEKLEAKTIKDNELIKYSTDAIVFLSDNIEFYNQDKEIYGDLEKTISLLKEKLSTYKVSSH
jgi:hypothetical protein